MSKIIPGNENYLNDYDREKDYKLLGVNAKAPAQAREINWMQEALIDNSRMAMDALVGDGAIIDGGRADIDDEITQCVLNSGKILYKGVVVLFKEAITSIDEETDIKYGIVVTRELITAEDDPSLRNPAVGCFSSNQPGADRIKLTGTWGVKEDVLDIDNQYFYPVHQIRFGTLVNQQPDSSDLVMEPLKALVRDYDRTSNGHFISEGMEVIFARDRIPEQTHILTIAAGLAHVYGYKIVFSNDTPIEIDWALDKSFVNNEPAQFNEDGWYSLRKYPISDLGEIFGTKEMTRDITHGGYSGVNDELPDQPVMNIISITQGGNNFLSGVDFVQKGNYVDWSLAGSEPASGSTYECVYEYTAEITQSVQISDDFLQIYVSGLKSGTLFYSDYNYYLPRYDIVNLLYDGSIKITKGLPADLDDIVKPQETEGLLLCSVLVYYAQEPDISMEGIKVFKMSDIQEMNDDIYDMKLAIARLSQASDVKEKNPTTVIKNQFVDPFFDDDLRDSGQEQNALIFDGILTPGMSWKGFTLRTGNDIKLPFVEQNYIDQPAYSSDRQINKFDYAEHDCEIKVSPKFVRWISGTVRSTTSGISEDKNATIPANTFITVSGGTFALGEQVKIFIDDEEVAETTSNVETGNIEVNFAIPTKFKQGVKAIDAIGQTSEGTASTALYTNAQQMKTAVIINNYHKTTIQRRTTVIEKRVTVNVPIRVFPRPKPMVRRPIVRRSSRASTARRTVSRPLTLRGSSSRTVRRRDPVAQTFTPELSGFISSIEIYLTVLPPDPNEFIEAAIHSTIVGIPERDEILVNKIHKSSELIVGWNKFTFEEPFYLPADTEYALVIFSPDVVARTRYAEIGQYDYNSGAFLSNQVHGGVFQESANRSTWSALPKQDLTFKINYAVFEEKVEGLLLGSITVEGATDINLTTMSTILEGTSAAYYAKLTGRIPNPTTGLPETVLLSVSKTSKISTYTGVIEFYVDMHSFDEAITPTLEGDIVVSIGKVEDKSTYISREFTVDGDDSIIHCDIFEASNSSVKFYYEEKTPATGYLPCRGSLGTELYVTTEIETEIELVAIDSNTAINIVEFDGKGLYSYTVNIHDGITTMQEISDLLKTKSQISYVAPANPNKIWILSEHDTDFTVTPIISIAFKSEYGSDANMKITMLPEGVSGSEVVTHNEEEKTLTILIEDGVSTQQTIINALNSHYLVDQADCNTPGAVWELNTNEYGVYGDMCNSLGGDEWKPYERTTETTPLGDGWIDTKFEAIDTMSDKTKNRVKIEMTLAESLNRPYAENLRTIIV